MEKDIRWEQRFSNYAKALRKLDEAVEYISGLGQTTNGNILDEILKEGLIQRFEYTFELAWNVMKDYAEYQGNPDIGGSRDAIREAFDLQLITDGKLWMDMINSRVRTSHTYNEATADEIYRKVLDIYHPAFVEFLKMMEDKRSGNQENYYND